MNWIRDRRLRLSLPTELHDVSASRLPLSFAVTLTSIFFLGVGVGIAVIQDTQAKPEASVAKLISADDPAARKPDPDITQPTRTQAAQPQAIGTNDDASYQPVIHAKEAGLSACLNGINTISRMTVDSTHAAVSTWNKDDPNDRMFNSVVGLTYKSQVAPKAVSVLVTAPTIAKKCDGTTVQVQPSSLTCDAIEKNLSAGSKEKFNDMNSIPMIQTSQMQRFLLMPTQDSGCVVVAVNTYFAQ